MTQQARVWTHSPFSEQAVAILAPLAEVVTGTRHGTDEWFAQAASCDAMIIGGTTIINGPVLDRIGPRLVAVARPGIGFDCIDLQAASERGVIVTNTPDGPTESTAEHAIALMLSLTKEVVLADRILRSGAGFPNYGSFPPGLELRGATLGLVGLGRIGGRVAEIARVLGMRVLAYDPFITPERAATLGVEPVATLEAVLNNADVVSLHCPASPETHHLINAERLAQMRRGAYLINVARGAIIDEQALVEALRSGHLAAAGLDVFENEPTIPDHPLYSLPNTVCTPHIASYTGASVLRMQLMACEQVAMALRGERPTSLVNSDVWGKTRMAQRIVQ